MDQRLDPGLPSRCLILLLTFLTQIIQTGRTLTAEKLVSINPDKYSLTVRSNASDLRDSSTSVEIQLKNLLTNQYISRSFTGSRYEYQVDNLTPDTWYGLTFKGLSKTDAKEISGVQYALAHTLPTSGDENAGKELALAQISWDESAIVVTWTTSANEAFDIIGDSTLICSGKNISKALRLNATHPNGKQNFTIDQQASSKKLLDIKSGKNETHRWVDMDLKVGNCSKFCWKYWIKAGAESYTHSEKCREISEIKERIQFQTIKDIVVGKDQLVILTNGVANRKPETGTDSSQDKGTIKSAYVLHTAVELVDMTRVEQVPEYDFFNQTSTFYTISGLDENTWYAMTFKNVLTAPIKYFTEEHSILKTTGGDIASDEGVGNNKTGNDPEYSLSNRDTKMIRGGDGETVQQSKYALLELKASTSNRDIIAEARSLLPNSLDLELTVQGSCQLEGVQGKLTQDSPIWTVRFSADNFALKSASGANAGGKESSTVTESPNIGGDESTNSNGTGIMAVMDEKRGAEGGDRSPIEKSNLPESSQSEDSPGGCRSLCWSYNVVIREVDESFPVGMECFPLDTLLDMNSAEVNNQTFRDTGEGLQFSKYLLIFPLVINMLLYLKDV